MDKDIFDPVKANAENRRAHFMDEVSRRIYDNRVQYAMTGDDRYLKEMIRDNVPLFTRGGICGIVSLAQRNSGCLAPATTGG